jgi:hypothetical protein
MRIRKDTNNINSVSQQTQKMKKGEISIYFSISILNVNSLNSSIKRYRLAK